MAFIHTDTVLVVPDREHINNSTFLHCYWCRLNPDDSPIFNFQEEGLVQYPQSKFMANKYQNPLEINGIFWQKVYINTLVYDHDRNPLGFFCSITSWRTDQIHAYTIGVDHQNVPANNQGLSNCFWCGNLTKKIDNGFSFYDYCAKCKK